MLFGSRWAAAFALVASPPIWGDFESEEITALGGIHSGTIPVYQVIVNFEDAEGMEDDWDANGVPDVFQPDQNSDGTIDACDEDVDGDGIENECDPEFTGSPIAMATA